jgi:hypothetical protein
MGLINQRAKILRRKNGQSRRKYHRRLPGAGLVVTQLVSLGKPCAAQPFCRRACKWQHLDAQAGDHQQRYQYLRCLLLPRQQGRTLHKDRARRNGKSRERGSGGQVIPGQLRTALAGLVEVVSTSSTLPGGMFRQTSSCGSPLQSPLHFDSPQQPGADKWGMA